MFIEKELVKTSMSIVVSHPQKIKPKWRSFTFNESQYQDAAEKEVQLLTRNPNSKHYWLTGTLNFEAMPYGNDVLPDPLSYKQHKEQWSKFSRYIRDKGIVLYWVREITREWLTGDYGPEEMELIHYHFIILDCVSEKGT